jgi:hypothetical protein
MQRASRMIPSRSVPCQVFVLPDQASFAKHSVRVVSLEDEAVEWKSIGRSVCLDVWMSGRDG